MESVPRCELCEREVPRLTEHHLIPRAEGRRGEVLPVAQLCSACHRQLHALFSNAELARTLNTLEKIRANPAMARFLGWVRGQPATRQVRVRRGR